jgi:hypothetical protein
MSRKITMKRIETTDYRGFLATVIDKFFFGPPEVRQVFSGDGDEWFWKDSFRPVRSATLLHELRKHTMAFIVAQRLGIPQS